MKEDTTIIELAHRVVEKIADRQARIGYISAEELDYAVLAQEVISINQQLTEKDVAIEELWDMLNWTLSGLTRYTAGEPVPNLDEIIAGASGMLKKHDRDSGEGENR